MILRRTAGATAMAVALAFQHAAAGESAARLEDSGDAEWRAAVPHYQAALEDWERSASAALRLGDAAGVLRSAEERARLALRLRSPGILELLRREAPSLRAPGPRAASADGLLVPPGRREGSPAPEELARLSRLLGAAARRHGAVGTGLDERDGLLVLEASALVHRLQAEELQARVDAAYRGALLALPAAGAGDAPAALAASRLRFKLRDLAGAKAVPVDWRKLPARDSVEHLARLRAIAVFEGDGAGAASIAEEIRRLGGKEEEPARPGAPFQSLLLGSSVDLAATVRTLSAVLGAYRLGPRERAFTALLAGDAAAELGEVALAEELLRSAGESGDPWLDASVLARLGAARGQLGDHEPAILSLQRARSVLGGSAGPRGGGAFAARLALNLARSLIGLGQLDLARRECLEVLRDEGSPAGLKVRSRILLGTCVYEEAREDPARLGDARSAFEAARRALEDARSADPGLEGSAELEATVLVNVANVLRLEGQRLAGAAAEARRKEAAATQDRALRTAHEAGLWALAAIASANLAELHLEAGDLEAARSFAAWALERATEHRLFETEWRCHWYFGRIADAEGEGDRGGSPNGDRGGSPNAAAADAAYARASAIVESYRSRVLDAERKSGFLTDKMAFYRDLVGRELRRGRADRALTAAERAKARALVDSLGWRFVALADPRQTDLYREYVSLLSRSERARSGEKRVLLGLEARPPSYDDLRARLEASRARIAAARDGTPALRALLDGDPSDAAGILRGIPERSTLVEYFSLGRSHAALVATREGVEAVELPVPPAELDGLVARFLRSGAADPALARRLHALLVAPLEGLLRGERLVVVPYGSLHQLPFETLAGDAGPLVSRWDIVYLPSASVLKHLGRARVGPPRSLAAFVDPDTDYDGDGKPDMPPLPHAREEVAALAPSFVEQEVLVGPAALKPECLRRAAGYDVLHYACHGEFYPARPWDSSLFLAPAEGGGAESGKLKASEVYALDLRRSRLVALSGCETGKSRVGPGDDAVSIGTAFLHSGASSLLVSLWKVEDTATAALMKTFYEKWIRGGRDKARALRETKLELLAGRFPHPRQWGAFVLLGEP